MKKNQLTYIYLNGRLNRYNKGIYPKEFFYGFDYIKKFFNDSKIIEFDFTKNSGFLYIISKLLEKLSGLPFFLQGIINKKNYNLFIKSDLFVMTNQRLAFSSFPFLILNKLIKRTKTSVFIMGLYDVEHKNIIKNTLRKLNILLLMSVIDNLLFLSKGEFEYVRNKYPNLGSKSYFTSFPVDTDFWKVKNKKEVNKKILFIGNDGKRDYEFIVNLAKEMSDYQFTIISSKIDKNQIKSNNVNLIYGKWDEEILTDEEIKKQYQNSALTVIPIKESLQPSGQSVALQSISCGTPVLITNTKGFWDPKLFNDEKNIIFVDKNEIQLWKDKINKCLNDKDFYNNLSIKGRENIEKHYDINSFNEKLKNILFNY
tara:strand:- start:1122 stop:2231 length:1110 start_codon:yes stop_codon:yes gene_type:complete